MRGRLTWVATCIWSVSAFFCGAEIPAPSANSEVVIRLALEDGVFDLAEDRARMMVRETKGAEKARAIILLAEVLHRSQKHRDALDLLERHQDILNVELPDARIYWEAVCRYELGDIDQWDALVKNADEVDLSSPYFDPLMRLFLRRFVDAGQLKTAYDIFSKLFEENGVFTNSPEMQLAWVNLLVLNGELNTAVSLLEQVTSRWEGEPARQGKRWLARLYFELGNAQEAAEILELVPEVDQQNPLMAAKIQWELGNKSNALARVMNAETQGPLMIKPIARSLRAEWLILEGKELDAFDLLENGIVRWGDHAALSQAMFLLARAFVNSNEMQKAEEVYSKVLNVFPDVEIQAKAMFGKGLSLVSMERYAEARGVFESALRLTLTAEEEAIVRLKLADVMFEMNAFSDAEKMYDLFLSISPKHPGADHALFQRATCKAKQGNVDEAVTQLKDLIKSKPILEARVYRTIPLLYLEGDKHESALHAYQYYIMTYSNRPDIARVLLEYGALEYRLGQFEKAEDAFKKASRKNTTVEVQEMASYWQGWALFLQGKEEGAYQHFQKFVERFPESRWIEYVLFWSGEYYFNREEYEKAGTLFQRIPEEIPEGQLKDKALYWAGRSYVKQQSFVKAIGLLKQVPETYPESEFIEEALFWQAEALTMLGEFSSAILVYERIIRDFPGGAYLCQSYGRMGDCHFVIGGNKEGHYDDAEKAFRWIMDQASCSGELKLQAEYKLGRTFEKQGFEERAINAYRNVFYQFYAGQRQYSKIASVWFVRAGFAVAKQYEKKEEWEAALNVYQRLSSYGGVAAEGAAVEMKRVREKYLAY